MRFPIKFVILPVFALPLLAAHGLTSQRAENRCFNRSWPWFALATMALIFAVVAWNGCFPPPDDNQRMFLFNALTRVILFAAIAGGLLLVEKIPELKPRRWLQLLLLLLVWLDLFRQAPQPPTVNRAIYQPNLQRMPVAPQPGAARAMVPPSVRDRFVFSYLPDAAEEYVNRRIALIWNCNLLDDIPKCDGFFPLELRDHADLFARDLTEPMLDFVGAAQIIRMQTNAFHWEARAGSMPLLSGGQKPVFTNDAAALQTLLTSTNFNPRREVYLPLAAKAFVMATNAAVVNISSIRFSAQRVEAEVQADAPALLVAAQMDYHPWRAYVDGQPTPVLRANYGFQALEVPAGSHDVRLVYEDWRFYLGAVISLGTLMGCLVFWRVQRCQSPSSMDEPVK